MSNGEKKGMSPVAWVAIGCGGCLLLVLLAMGACGGAAWFKFGDAISEMKDNPAKGAAMMVVEANPDLELVSTDDDAGTMTIKKKNGETVTLDWEEISEGRFRIETSEGEVRFDASGDDGSVTVTDADGETTAVYGTDADIPGWLPAYPDSEDVKSAFSTSDGSASAGAYSFRSRDGLEEIVAWFTEELGDDGWTETSRFNQAGQLMNVSFEKDNRTLAVMAAPVSDGGASQVTVQYSEKP